jgi:hypothetical protein
LGRHDLRRLRWQRIARVSIRFVVDEGVVEMSEKPSYLGLLNAIAVGERGGEMLFETWATATPNDDVRCVLRTVALREGEHARAFAKRIDELGYSVRDRHDPGLSDRIEIARSSTLTDCEKFERLGYRIEPPTGPDIFAAFFDDTTIDIQTGELMGRYVAEERDTVRRLRACHCALAADQPPIGQAQGALIERLERIECALAQLAQRADKAEKRAKQAKKGKSASKQ